MTPVKLASLLQFRYVDRYSQPALKEPRVLSSIEYSSYLRAFSCRESWGKGRRNTSELSGLLSSTAVKHRSRRLEDISIPV